MNGSEKTGQPRIWLCDLTYTQQTVASDIMPAAVGGIGTYALHHFADAIDLRLFKFPEDLIRALESDAPPHVLGFSNYVWNLNLGAAFAGLVKERYPSVITVFGGPNYPLIAAEQEAFLRDRLMIDFYIVHEGEVAFAKLCEALIANDFDRRGVPADLPSVHRIMPTGEFHAAATADRVFDLSVFPSPYLTGLLDEYFERALLPIIQTNRGCPFKCTFCNEGKSYFTRIAKTRDDKTHREIRYIARKMAGQLAKGKGRTDLHIADSNFGMYKEDLDVCRSLAGTQTEYGYPKYINVATGKNNTENVLEAARTVGGAIALSGAVQSLDPGVLANIRRTNIKEREFLDLARKAEEIGANSHAEAILALPGDSRKAHFSTIERLVEAGFSSVSVYQLMLLPGTDLCSEESRRTWSMVSKFRALPRCYGHFTCLGTEINSIEIEEICVANDSITFADYVDCRRFHLIVTIFFNDGIFKEALRILDMLGIPKFSWLESIHRNRSNPEFNGLVEAFAGETVDELWDDPNRLSEFAGDRRNVERYIAGEIGANLLFKYKARAITRHVDAVATVAGEALSAVLESNGRADAVQFGEELILFGKLRLSDIFRDQDKRGHGVFRYAVDSFSRDAAPTSIDDYKLADPSRYVFRQTDRQKRFLRDFIRIYGDNETGLSRIITKVHISRLFRESSVEI